MILLDTHVLIWMASDPKRLSKKARDAIREARQKTGVAVATITLWELAWLAENGRSKLWVVWNPSFVKLSRACLLDRSLQRLSLSPSGYRLDFQETRQIG
jgi:PIN domain nuclease of toxin-antitoxin system